MGDSVKVDLLSVKSVCSCPPHFIFAVQTKQREHSETWKACRIWSPRLWQWCCLDVNGRFNYTIYCYKRLCVCFVGIVPSPKGDCVACPNRSAGSHIWLATRLNPHQTPELLTDFQISMIIYQRGSFPLCTKYHLLLTVVKFDIKRWSKGYSSTERSQLGEDITYG